MQHVPCREWDLIIIKDHFRFLAAVPLLLYTLGQDLLMRKDVRYTLCNYGLKERGGGHVTASMLFAMEIIGRTGHASEWRLICKKQVLKKNCTCIQRKLAEFSTLQTIFHLCIPKKDLAKPCFSYQLYISKTEL